MNKEFRVASAEAVQPDFNGWAKLRIRTTEGDTLILTVDAGKARLLSRESIRCLAITKIDRDPGQWWTTKQRKVEEAIAPILMLIGAAFPKTAKKAS